MEKLNRANKEGSDATTRKSLYQKFLDAGIDASAMGNHYSDLYVPVCKASTGVLKAHLNENKGNPCTIQQMPRTFRSLIPGEGLMYDIAFAYDPYWEEVARKSLEAQEKAKQKQDE